MTTIKPLKVALPAPISVADMLKSVDSVKYVPKLVDISSSAKKVHSKPVAKPAEKAPEQAKAVQESFPVVRPPFHAPKVLSTFAKRKPNVEMIINGAVVPKRGIRTVAAPAL